MFKATLKNNTIETTTFRNIENIYDIVRLETEDVVPVVIDFTTGVIEVNHKVSPYISDYFKAGAKPIQYRKGYQDFNKSMEVINEFEEQTVGYEYTGHFVKTKIEIVSNTEIKSVAAFIERTNLETQIKENNVVRLY